MSEQDISSLLKTSTSLGFLNPSFASISLDGDDEVSFGCTKIPKKKPVNKKKESLYVVNGKEMVYNDQTMLYYKALRNTRRDPITYEKLSFDSAFAVNYMWDPYTGERLGKDPYGPLYFCPDNLIYYFWKNRLKKLWIDDDDDMDQGYYQGTYDDAVGAGENFEVKGRGTFHEWYIFRLPIADCYLNKDHMRQVVTMGPKLTLSDVKELDRLANKSTNSYRRKYNKPRPSLEMIWNLYHNAISKTPQFTVKGKQLDEFTEEEQQQLKYKANCAAVNALREYG